MSLLMFCVSAPRVKTSSVRMTMTSSRAPGAGPALTVSTSPLPLLSGRIVHTPTWCLYARLSIFRICKQPRGNPSKLGRTENICSKSFLLKFTKTRFQASPVSLALVPYVLGYERSLLQAPRAIATAGPNHRRPERYFGQNGQPF